ncbi:hypothetical protein [Bradyrhizobium sp. cf659]|uniref:hypothetical protein n=1 Tax=Bradyrhizobium sp. cf659 TaxID=1761771 RepID=UPI0008EAEFE1|nr:hypothetical protein [Bradyrhizobium sp. cf659]SFJ96709.1 hypothetical protein SAMN04487925_1146 [Bradyrhizobium sp. cf659]
MLNLAGTPPLVTTPEADSRQLIAADLRCLIARIESSMRLIDAAMIDAGLEQDNTSDQAGSIDIFVLDDVTPRYAKASAALNVCRAGLGRALQYLSDSGDPV